MQGIRCASIHHVRLLDGLTVRRHHLVLCVNLRQSALVVLLDVLRPLLLPERLRLGLFTAEVISLLAFDDYFIDRRIVPFSLVYQLEHIVALVDIDKAKVLEADLLHVVKVDDVKDDAIVDDGHINAAELQTLDELLELNLAVVVNVESAEGLPIVLKLLLEAVVDRAQQHLDVLHVYQRLGPLRNRQTLQILHSERPLHRLSLGLLVSRALVVDVLEVLEALNLVLVVIVVHELGRLGLFVDVE